MPCRTPLECIQPSLGTHVIVSAFQTVLKSRLIDSCWHSSYVMDSHLICSFSCAAVAANAATLLMNATPGGQQTPKKFITPNSLDLAELASTAVVGSGDVNFPRRERFVFRPNHLEILERYFQDNNYPTYETREEIAKACNAVTESVGKMSFTI